MLSFEETTTKNRLSPRKRHGRGTRDRIRGFSRASLRNLLTRLASINRSAFRDFRACYELGRKSHRNADFTVSLVPSRSPFPAFLSHF
jgi:hypothetical protein